MNLKHLLHAASAIVLLTTASTAVAQEEASELASIAETDSDHFAPGPGNLPVQATTAPATQPEDQPLDQKILGWYGLRQQLEDKGLKFEFTVVADGSANLRGGADTEGQVFRHLFDARFTFDTEVARWWNGGTFSLDFQTQNGRNGSDRYGDAQGFANADADGFTEISELWYEHRFCEAFRIKAGKVDANSEFAAANAAGGFLNSSFGFSPTVTGMPTYPDPAVSVNLFWAPVEHLSVGYGIYDGGDGQPTGNHSPHTAWSGKSDYFHIAEIGTDWSLSGDTLPGRLAVGVSYANGKFDRFRGGQQNGTESLYVVLEQKLYNYATNTPENERGVYAFAQFGTADEEVNDFRHHIGAGVSWVGPYMADNLDTLGLGVTTVFFSDAAGSPYTQDSETTIEAYYNYQATPWLSLKPDLQYIIHPGGDATLDDALVATLRVTLAL